MKKSKRFPRALRKGAIFLDRDGVINACPTHRYVTSWKEFRFLPGVLRALRRLKTHRQTVIVVSNQSGVGKGMFTATRLKGITRRMRASIRRAGGAIRQVYYCVHRPDEGCPCRKPRPGMLQEAARRFSIDLKRSFVIGDHETDVRMGRFAGCRTILVLSGRYSRPPAKRLGVPPDRIAANLEEAVRWILSHPLP